MRWLHQRLLAYDCVESARHSARELAAAALREGQRALGPAAETEDGRFLLDLTGYVVERSRSAARGHGWAPPPSPVSGGGQGVQRARHGRRTAATRHRQSGETKPTRRPDIWCCPLGGNGIYGVPRSWFGRLAAVEARGNPV